MTHTPTPWNVSTWDDGSTHIEADDYILADMNGNGGGKRIEGFIPVAERKANAAFIIRAVNAHDELLKCAKTFRRFILSFYEGEDDDMAPTDTLKAVEIAIAKAEGR